MRPSPLTQFRTLAGEAILDAVRRRVVAAIAVVSLLSLMLVDTCTTCSGGEVVVNGEVREMVHIAGWTGTVTFVVLGLWSIILAGVLASEHLAQTFASDAARSPSHVWRDPSSSPSSPGPSCSVEPLCSSTREAACRPARLWWPASLAPWAPSPSPPSQ